MQNKKDSFEAYQFYIRVILIEIALMYGYLPLCDICWFIVEKYCQASDIPPFDLNSGVGHWMGATIRQTKLGEIMLNVAFHPQDLNKLQLKSVKEKLGAYFSSGPGRGCNINSLFFTSRKQWESGETENIYGMPNKMKFLSLIRMTDKILH